MVITFGKGTLPRETHPGEIDTILRIGSFRAIVPVGAIATVGSMGITGVAGAAGAMGTQPNS